MRRDIKEQQLGHGKPENVIHNRRLTRQGFLYQGFDQRIDLAEPAQCHADDGAGETPVPARQQVEAVMYGQRIVQRRALGQHRAENIEGDAPGCGDVLFSLFFHARRLPQPPFSDQHFRSRSAMQSWRNRLLLQRSITGRLSADTFCIS